MITSKLIREHPFYKKYKNYCTRGKGLDKLLTDNREGRFATNDSTQALLVVKELLGDKCKKVLEIGVLHGGSMILLQNSDFKSHFVGVDYFSYYGQKIDPHCNVIVSKENAERNIKKYNKKGHTFCLIDGDSHSKEVEEKLKEYDTFDLIFIDGDHTFEGCQKDFELATKLSQKGTIVIFDNWRCKGVDLDVKNAVMNSNIKDEYIPIGQFEDVYIIEKK